MIKSKVVGIIKGYRQKFWCNDMQLYSDYQKNKKNFYLHATF